MTMTFARTSTLCLVHLFLLSSLVEAQFTYRPGQTRSPATGEVYHVELGLNAWFTTPEMTVASEALGIAGTQIDLVQDLGFAKKRFPEARVVLRPGLKHKFRIHYLPIEYQTTSVITRSIVFNGVRYTIGLPVTAQLSWKAWRFGYEYDVLYRDRGFLGFILEAKYTDVETSLSAIIGTEFARARAPIPAIGAIGRVYVAPNVALTLEVSGFSVPDINEDYDGHYIDLDFYGTVNFTHHLGVQGGYRSLDVRYHVQSDDGDLVLRGPYLGGVVRF